MTREEKLELYGEIIFEAIQLQEISIKKAIGAYRSADSNEKDFYGKDRTVLKSKLISSIRKKGGPKAVAGAEAAAKVDEVGRRPGAIRQKDDPLKTRQEVIGREKKKGGRWYVPTKGKNKCKMPNSKELTKYLKVFHRDED